MSSFKTKNLILLIGSFFLLGIFYYLFSYRFILFQSMSPASHALSPTTSTLLQQFTAPITVRLHSKNIDTYHAIKILVERYQFIQPLLQFQWLKKDYPFSAHYSGQAIEVFLNHQRQLIDLELSTLNEAQLTQALFRLQRKMNQWCVFLQGHDEPSLYSKAPKDFLLLKTALENQGFNIQALNLQKTPFIADNAQLLVLASPKSALLPIEEALIQEYLTQGKDLLWLIDPHSAPITSLTKLFGVKALPGTIIDLHGQQLKTPHPAITIIDDYPSIPFTPPPAITAFPFATALTIFNKKEWDVKPFLTTNAQTWTETNELLGNIEFNPEQGEKAGPLNLGFYLTRAHPQQALQTQRIAIIGNSRFLNNGVIENYGNLALALTLFSWLNHDDTLLSISQPVAQGSLLQINHLTAWLIRYLFPAFSMVLLLFAFYLRYCRQLKYSSVK